MLVWFYSSYEGEQITEKGNWTRCLNVKYFFVGTLYVCYIYINYKYLECIYRRPLSLCKSPGAWRMCCSDANFIIILFLANRAFSVGDILDTMHLMILIFSQFSSVNDSFLYFWQEVSGTGFLLLEEVPALAIGLTSVDFGWEGNGSSADIVCDLHTLFFPVGELMTCFCLKVFFRLTGLLGAVSDVFLAALYDLGDGIGDRE